MLIDISNNILKYKSNLIKQKNYTINLGSNNFENKLHHIINAAGSDNLGYLSSWLYINIDNTCKHPTIKLVLVLANHKNLEVLIDPLSKMLVLIN